MASPKGLRHGFCIEAAIHNVPTNVIQRWAWSRLARHHLRLPRRGRHEGARLRGAHVVIQLASPLNPYARHRSPGERNLPLAELWSRLQPGR